GYKLARRYALKALELDDTLPEAHTSLAWVQFAYDWDWAAAERSYRRALELNPAYATGHHWYSFVLLVTGQADQALVEAHTALELEARARDHYVSPVAFCIVHLGLRNTDQVFTWLERAYQDRRGWLTYLKVDPMLDVVKDDPRFAEFVKRMKL